MLYAPVVCSMGGSCLLVCLSTRKLSGIGLLTSVYCGSGYHTLRSSWPCRDFRKIPWHAGYKPAQTVSGSRPVSSRPGKPDAGMPHSTSCRPGTLGQKGQLPNGWEFQFVSGY
ncbi:hypothetical protein RRG08_045522 [Elysia crispata]|uniref:Uncharacterized protein n=1 Tax=Elysia crispata TaxID=231223 RepID=A0AAE1CWI8_9GAST|nr:hypothetical protein RRG08_045522 [Elysia crispata]